MAMWQNIRSKLAEAVAIYSKSNFENTAWRCSFATKAYGSSCAAQGSQWKFMVDQGHELNPCNSKLHPAVKDAGIEPKSKELKSVQEAYNPQSICFGCGPSHSGGLRLRSYRCPDGLEARVRIPSLYCAFPGIINGGIVSTLLDCHGNWTAAIALMDRGFLPKPPLTMADSIAVTFKEPVPPDTELLLTSEVMSIRETHQTGFGKVLVEVEVKMFIPAETGVRAKVLLAEGTGVFQRLGALRAM